MLSSRLMVNDMRKGIYVRNLSLNQVSVYTECNALMASFQGPMARVAALAFIKSCEKDTLGSALDLEEYVK